MRWFVYILLCDTKTFYVGVTGNLSRRIIEHKNKSSFYTKQFTELRLVYQETFESEKDALRRERQLKGWSVAKKKALVVGNKVQLVKLSKST